MIKASKYKKHKVIPTLRAITCPACDKDRLLREQQPDGTVQPANQETVEVREQIRYLDVCEFCVIRYRKEDERFVMENMRKLSKALKDNKPDDGESDHKDFSLN